MKPLRRWWRLRGRKIVHRATAGQRDRLRLWRAGALPPVMEFARARPSGALGPDFNDLWSLYCAVRSRRPTTLLEFGAGCSTAVLAFALEQNREGHLWSLDGEEKWARSTEAALPEPLRPFVTVIHSPVQEDDRDALGWSYEHLPDIDPDFVYLDGPDLTRERQIAFDVLDLEPRLQPGCLVVVDGRRENAKYLRDRLTRTRFVERGPWRYTFEVTE